MCVLCVCVVCMEEWFRSLQRHIFYTDVELLLCSSKFYYDVRLRNALVDLYSSLYGRLTPTCVPEGVSDHMTIT